CATSAGIQYAIDFW
nr:immunoglobulin heavy chain junction region [Macaca mulatta]